ncbi:MAG: single-stranded-DNA-specific exonuclease RecJ [Alphaproteobacteria bacterium]|nr:single-stranded-DNA-specific exonuclease RecJ [Alphaproteobacteria bacterium]
MSQAFLGVEKSFTNRRWIARAYDERMTLALAQRYELPDCLARSLSARGIDLDTAASFLDPKLRDLLPDPSRFVDMDKAATRLINALQSNEKIAVFGDYDVDGATSSALLIRFLRSLGVDSRLYIPDRLKEGYGPNSMAMKKLAGEGIKLVICVDCGTTAHEPLKTAGDEGLDVIVIDHHAAEPSLPTACAIVNPNRIDEKMTPDFGMLAAVGVTYLFVIAVNRKLRELKWFSSERPEPDLRQWLDLVALGTICDVVKLTGLNRAFVAQGLNIMGRRQNAGIAALAKIASVKDVLDSYAAGFILGPRINAGGRVGSSDLGARLLACDDMSAATLIAEQLNKYNTDRREIEAQVLAEAEAMTFDEASPITFVASENWHAGVIGIVAARLKEKFHRPALVIGIEGDVGKGSGRSIGNIDLGAAIIAARQAGLIVNGGGHKMAAGFTVVKNKIEDLKKFLSERIGRQLEAEPFEPSLSIDGLAATNGLNEEFVEKLSALSPFGAGNPEPRFALADCRIIRASIVGEKHVSLIIAQGGSRLRAIAFRAMENGLGIALMSIGASSPCHLAGHIRADNWKGDGSAQLLVDDGASA